MSTDLEFPSRHRQSGESLSDPYVGPEPFRREDAWRFFGRRDAAEELLSLLIASRTVLLYAQSGAGKTSLVNAGLLPLAEAEGFDILPPARVQGILPGGLAPRTVSNPYAFFTLLSWRAQGGEAEIDPQGSLRDALRGRPRPADRFGAPLPRLVIFDQFEELFTSFPEHWGRRRELLEQVEAALADDPELRVLFVIREDHLADLWAMGDLMPDRLRSRFRLARLGRQEAAAAIEGPLARTDRSFAAGVVDELVDELLKIRVETMPGVTTEIVGDVVEPVQLQVVCSGLWRSVPRGATVITADHARRFGDVTAALAAFYEEAVTETSAATGVSSRRIREWCTSALITAAGTRAMVYRGVKETEGMPNRVVDLLENLHIIRAESRAGARWYELTHDRFIGPIRRSNAHEQQRRRRRALLGVGAIAGLGMFGLIPLGSGWLPYLNVVFAVAGFAAVWAIVGLVLRNRRILLGAGFGLLLAAVAFCVVYFGLARPVPVVIGLPRAAAFSLLSSQGFAPAAVYVPTRAVPAGIVIRQPGAGGRSWRGERVLVWVSFGPNAPS